jgi:hypothetical protein
VCVVNCGATSTDVSDLGTPIAASAYAAVLEGHLVPDAAAWFAD